MMKLLKISEILPLDLYLIVIILAPIIQFSSAHSISEVGANSPEIVPNYVRHPTLIRPIFTNITQGGRHVYHYTFNTSLLSTWPAYQLQFYAETEHSTSFPLLVTAYLHGSIRSWEIPVQHVNPSDDIAVEVNRFSDHVVGKTFWHFPQDDGNAMPWNLTVTIEFHSFSEITVYYKMKLVILKDFMIPETPTVVTAIASPSSPAIYKFTLPNVGWEYLSIRVLSSSDTCGIMAIQNLIGPFVEVGEKSEYFRITETFTLQAGLTMKGDKFRNTAGFLISFLPLEYDASCKQSFDRENANPQGLRIKGPYQRKLITFEITGKSSPLASYAPILLPIILYSAFAACSLSLTWKFNNMRCNTFKKDQLQVIVRKHSLFKSNITIDSLISTPPSRLVDQSRRYFMAALVSTIFYSVPVFQLIFSFSNRLDDTGDNDICYYNHFCSQMLGNFRDFNHMYSNIGYFFFAFLYAVTVKVRQLYGTPTHESGFSRGVFVHHGLLYSLAFALWMTGTMSAGYHICPNQSNFQFDTVFMYTVAAITVVTIYQFRHPTYLSANLTFIVLAIVTCISVLGLLWEMHLIRICFTVMHMLFLTLSLPKVCYNGFVRKDGQIVFHWFEMMQIVCMKYWDDFKTNSLFKVQHYLWRAPSNPEIVIIPGPGRVILPIFLLAINSFSIIIMWTILHNQNFATQVLFVCVINGSMYTVFYSGLKLYHGECKRLLWVQPCFYLISSFILWGLAMKFFVDEFSTWETSPAESREKNADCIVMGFYDSHDMWHFLSSAALFCSAMVLLTVDDDLVDQHKSTIPVF